MVEPDAFIENNTVSSQINKSLSSSIKDFGSALSGTVKAAQVGVGDLLNNVSSLAGKFNSIGMGAGNSVTAALNQLGSLGNYSKFKDNFIPPSKINSLKPEASRPGPVGNYTFPNDIGDYFIVFTWKKYDRKVPIGNPVLLPTAVINLPIPTNLQEQFSMQVTEKQLGVAGLLNEVVGTALEGGGTKDSFQKAGEQLRGEITKPGTAYYVGRTLAGLSDSLGAAVDLATGVALNPFQAMVFQGVNLRSHQFTYRFSPNSKQESETLRKIIMEFKRRMHPTKDGLILQFPDVCDIKFGNKESPYFFKEACFLDSMTVNYAPAGQPAFFAGTNQPVEIEVSLSFKETVPIMRDDFKLENSSSIDYGT